MNTILISNIILGAHEDVCQQTQFYFIQISCVFIIHSYKKTVVYDPAKSETYKALQDQELGDYVQEVTPVPSKVFAPVKVK